MDLMRDVLDIPSNRRMPTQWPTTRKSPQPCGKLPRRRWAKSSRSKWCQANLGRSYRGQRGPKPPKIWVSDVFPPATWARGITTVLDSQAECDCFRDFISCHQIRCLLVVHGCSNPRCSFGSIAVERPFCNPALVGETFNILSKIIEQQKGFEKRK